MKDWRNVLIAPDAQIMDVIQVIEKRGLAIALVANENNQLQGIVTDADIRRALLKNIDLKSAVSEIMNATPLTISPSFDQGSILTLMQSKSIYHLPVVDSRGEILDLKVLNDLLQFREHVNSVVLMAGGLGERLRPLTNDKPKPMLHVQGQPILQVIVERFVESGFKNFFIALNYKGDLIKNHFGDGSQYDANIQYVEEKTRLGTAGALSLLPRKFDNPFVVMNADIITKVNFESLIEFHISQKAKATMCVQEYDFQVPYGVVKLDDHSIVDMSEKPVQRFFVNAGIYVFSPEILDLIPSGEYYDMDALFKKLIESKYTVSAFPLREYWLDVGRSEDLERANMFYKGRQEIS